MILRHIAAALRGKKFVMDAGLNGVREYFSDLDVDGNGKVNSYEMQKALVDKGLGLTLPQAGQFVRLMDGDKSGSVEVEEFIRAVADEEVHFRNTRLIAVALSTRKELFGKAIKTVEEAFQAADHNNDGSLSHGGKRL